ncbi:DUF397 domain-containing protein [Streptomyces mirabilis]|uniref:DUF397 domain-containing protein n=1 Tax=Streptomyces mirabilis TaxID=68239 RepID=A0A1I2RWL9_9ACTN|nr:DUF397 domain-containing protein [Streptomyces mirabilis]SFG42151.1 protein of unknown function [Streptomyces mirabilis]
MPDFNFVKSSHSQLDGECLEVARNIPGTIAIRDSKSPDGPILRLTPTAWAQFTTSGPMLSRQPVRSRPVA